MIFMVFAFGLATKNKVSLSGSKLFSITSYPESSQNLLDSKQLTGLLSLSVQVNENQVKLISLVKSGQQNQLTDNIKDINEKMSIKINPNPIKLNNIQIIP